MSEKEMQEILDCIARETQRAIDDPEYALQTLKDEGYLDENGDLAERYR